MHQLEHAMRRPDDRPPPDGGQPTGCVPDHVQPGPTADRVHGQGAGESVAWQDAHAHLLAHRVEVVAEEAAAAALDAARVAAAQPGSGEAVAAGELASSPPPDDARRASPGTGADVAEPIEVRQAPPVPPVGTPIRVATVGLVLVLLGLAVFSVIVSIRNSDGTERAQIAAAESDLFETAHEALLAQEESAEEVVAADEAETRSDYAAAALLTHSALRSLHGVAAASYGADHVEGLLDTHRHYGIAVEAMFEVATVQGPEAAELYEEAHVDVYYEPLAEALDAQAKVGYEDARVALASIAQAQQQLRLATPALFGAALVLLATFIVLLRRSRRLVGVQAEENRQQSLHDSLTGLPNRTVLHRDGALCLQQSAVTAMPTALILLDLDRFKEINDTLGHHHGDVVLQAVSQRLSRAVRSSDVVVRLGGDEFAILLPQIQDVADAFAIAVQVQETLRPTFDAGGILLDVDSSMGVALSGLHGDDVATLLKHADIAMYRAKANDLGVCVYDEEFNQHSPDQLGLLGELRRAIDHDELVLHFQPKIALPGGGFCGAEALLRWEHPTRGLILPDMFLPAAERTALIRPLTAWVLNAALAECKRWQEDGEPLTLAVNISARNLFDASFGDSVLELLERWDLPTSCLLLEVTESAIMVEPARAETILRRLTAIGIELSIDDFGSGYTSLAHLRTLPVQELKIDQSLVRQMSTSAADTLITSAIIRLAHDLGLRTVAEGVEEADILDRLSEMGCDIAQGYYLARPMPAADLRRWSHGDLPPLRPALAEP